VDSSAIEVARVANKEIRALAEHLNAEGDEDDPYEFFCEDGCGAMVVLTLAAYVAANGAWLDGHKLSTPSN
jgi:hypothetical protein